MAKSTVSLGEDYSRCRVVVVPLPYLLGNIQGLLYRKTYRILSNPFTLNCKVSLHMREVLKTALYSISAIYIFWHTLCQ